jgi:hypothetical protein
MSLARPEIRCRGIRAGDLGAVTLLLEKGFPERDHTHWLRGLKRMAEHVTPPGFPKYGFLLECDGKAVGVILVIFSAMTTNGEDAIRGNVASWYVEPAFRGYASMLTSHALARKNVTYLNISPAPSTWPILEAQGYQRYCTGQFMALAALHRGPVGASVSAVANELAPGEDLSASERELLLAHASYGCMSVVATTDQRRHPFVFMRCWHRWKVGRLPYALLVYCRSLDEFVEFAGPLGRYLAWRGMPMVFIDSIGSVPGLIGRTIDMSPKFYKGPKAPHLGDVAYTEHVMFDL